MSYIDRTYREQLKKGALSYFEVAEGETDLAICADADYSQIARSSVAKYRRDLKEYISHHPNFQSALEPLSVDSDAPIIVSMMAGASMKAGVGPMASVAGAFAQLVGRDIMKSSEEVIVENGGDIFISSRKKRTIGVYAGEISPFRGRIALEIGPCREGLGICTSSAEVGHSLSFGKSDAVVIISKDTALADAAATAAGNLLRAPDDIEKTVNFARSIEGVSGILVMIADKMGSWGSVKIV